VAAPLDEVFQILRELLRDNDLELSPATRFDGLTDWDSMDLVAVVVEIECRYDLLFEAVEIDRLVTVDDLVRAINLKRALAAA
jgi:acyl carrier protein